MLRLIAVLIASLTLTAGCGSREEPQGDRALSQNASVEEAALYTCPMHPSVTSTRPGDCPTCGMKLVPADTSETVVSAATPPAQIREAKRLLADAKRSLARERKYRCCIEIPCDQCALEHQSCSCYENLKAGKPVCPECYGGWQRGEGKDKSIVPSSVKTEFGDHRH